MEQHTHIEDKEHTFIWLLKDRTMRQRIFHCFICEYPLFKFQGHIKSVIPSGGLTEIENVEIMKFPFIVECRGGNAKWGKCMEVYIFEGYVE